MRGAGLRLNNDVRRLWRCPVCGLERKAGADVTSVTCDCANRPAMKLIETPRLARPLKEPVSPYLEFVFEPGELNPPRPPVEEEHPSDSEGDHHRDDKGGDSTAEAAPAERPVRADARPPRRRDRSRPGSGPMSDTGSPPRDPGGRTPKGPRPDRTPRSPDSERSSSSDAQRPPQDKRRSQAPEPNRRPPAQPMDEFGAGIPSPPEN